jgi:hypothetical protein
MKPDM